MTVQDGLVSIPKARLNVINPMAEQQKAKGIFPITTESGEIMLVHPDIVQDEQWETSKPVTPRSTGMEMLLQHIYIG